MRVDGKFRLMVIVGVLGAGAGIAVLAHGHSSVEQDRTAIERRHQLDVETTLSDKADELAKLWDVDAVRIQPDVPAEIGKAVIYANDKRWETSSGGEKTLCYKPEIRDLQIAGEIVGRSRASMQGERAHSTVRARISREPLESLLH
jgi:hypothetical protein